MHFTSPAAPTSGIRAAAPPRARAGSSAFPDAPPGATPRYTALGTVVEGAVDVPIRKHWSINGYGGMMSAGPVVRNWFTNKRLTFWSVENVVRF
jgi:hypothetical protein